jgi:poly(3-hydroxyalkanoate) synthetase
LKPRKTFYGNDNVQPLREASITAAAAEYQFWTGATPSGGFEDWSAAALQHKGSWWYRTPAGTLGREEKLVHTRRPS